VRRKPGSLVPLEIAICIAASDLLGADVAEFHGYQIAKYLATASDRRLLTAYGTLYRALARLESMGLLVSHKEDPAIAARENRPGRRLYALTTAGEQVARQAREIATEPQRAPRPRKRPLPA